MPVILIHGGPGGSSGPGFLRLIDSDKFKIIAFDQRGCGRSEPAGLLENNSLAHTLADMEALRTHLGIDKWVVSGGSWGSTVALAYAQAYPEACLGLLSIATWLCRAKDIEWWFHGVRTVFPELWEQFAAGVPLEERADLREAYCRRVLGPDQLIADEAAARLFLYEEGFMRFEVPLQPPEPQRGKAYGRIFTHYAAHNFFVSENQLIDQAHRIAHLPAIFVSGRYDMCTTPDNAYDMVRMLPKAELRVIPSAGHYPTEPALARACVAAGDDLFLKVLQERGVTP